MNQKERDAEIKSLGYEINHLRIQYEKKIKKYTYKIPEPKGFFNTILYGYYNKKLENTEKILDKIKQNEVRLAAILKDEMK